MAYSLFCMLEVRSFVCGRVLLGTNAVLAGCKKATRHRRVTLSSVLMCLNRFTSAAHFNWRLINEQHLAVLRKWPLFVRDDLFERVHNQAEVEHTVQDVFVLPCEGLFHHFDSSE